MKWKAKNNTKPSESNPKGDPIAIPIEDRMIQPEGNIRVVENKILFYCDVDDDSCLELNRILIELDDKLQTLKVSLGEDYDPVIHLHIKTNGGEVFSAFATIDTIRNLKSKVYTYIDGYVASAGTLISCVGNRRFIGKYGHMLIHQVSGEFYGKFAEMEDSFSDYKNLMILLKEIYKEYTKVPMKKIDEILKHDLSFTAQECVDYGLVDEIL